MRSKGFSLLEVIVVVAIIATISAVAVPKVGNYLAVANTTRIASDLRNIDAVIIVYQMQYAEGLPPGSAGIAKLKEAKLLDSIPEPPSGQCFLAGSTDLTAVPGNEYTVEVIDGSFRAVLGMGNTAEKFKN